MKNILVVASLLYSSLSHSAVVEYITNFGGMYNFDGPELITSGSYPNPLNEPVTFSGGNPDGGCSTQQECDSLLTYRYFGFKFSLTDTYQWQDGHYVHDIVDSLRTDFYINIFAGGSEYNYKVENNGSPWLHGSFYHETPTAQPIGGLKFTLTTEDGLEKGSFIFDMNRTAFYVSDKPLRFVPEPETFALFLLGAVGLCVRRQIKANATLPV